MVHLCCELLWQFYRSAMLLTPIIVHHNNSKIRPIPGHLCRDYACGSKLSCVLCIQCVHVMFIVFYSIWIELIWMKHIWHTTPASAGPLEWDVWNKPTELRLVVAVVYFQPQHNTTNYYIYIFIHGRPLGSYDATLRQNNIWKVTVHVSDDTLSRQAERSSDRASNFGRAASQSLKRLPSGYCAPPFTRANRERRTMLSAGRRSTCPRYLSWRLRTASTQAPLPLFGSPHRWWHADSGC